MLLCRYLHQSVSSVAHMCTTPCNPVGCSTLGFSVQHQLLENVKVMSKVSVIPSSHLILLFASPPAFKLSQHQGLSQWVSSLYQLAKVLEFQLQHQSFQWTPRTDFLYDWLVWFPCNPRDSQESSTPQYKSLNSSALSFLYSPTLTFIHDHWKNHSFDSMDLCQ